MFTARVITVSDRSYRGEREDAGGPLVRELLTKAGYTVDKIDLVPDEQELIERALRCASQDGVALVVTTGGTGFAPRDVTPEATVAVCEKLAPGIPEAMRAASMAVTPRAMLSRAAAGIRDRTLIINLPGSPRAVRENLGFALPALEHGIAILVGDAAECARQ